MRLSTVGRRVGLAPGRVPVTGTAPGNTQTCHEGERMPVNANLDKVLDKAYENKSLGELVNAPVDALSGVTEGDAQLLQQAFNIKTVGDLGRNKYFREAAALVDLAQRAEHQVWPPFQPPHP